MVWKGFKFPEEPPEINRDDPYEDPVALLEYREWLLRQKVVRVEKAKLLREKVKKCYKEEGVNHLKNCREIVEKYLESIKDIGVHVNNAGPNDLGRDERRAKFQSGG